MESKVELSLKGMRTGTSTVDLRQDPPDPIRFKRTCSTFRYIPGGGVGGTKVQCQPNSCGIRTQPFTMFPQIVQSLHRRIPLCRPH